MLLHIEIGLQAIVAAPRPSTRQFAIARPHPTIVLADATGPGDQQDADASEPGRSGNIQRQIDLQPFSDILPCIRNVKPALAIAPQAQQRFGALPDRQSAGLFRHTRQRVGDAPQSASAFERSFFFAPSLISASGSSTRGRPPRPHSRSTPSRFLPAAMHRKLDRELKHVRRWRCRFRNGHQAILSSFRRGYLAHNDSAECDCRHKLNGRRP
jgi:hypothetical protein